jgi:hypothetical protein
MPTCLNQFNPMFARLSDPDSAFSEIKDPCVVKDGVGTYHLFASIGNSVTQKWKVGHFISTNPSMYWEEVQPVNFEGIYGPELCAPAVTYCAERVNDPWVMYIQTSCFSEQGIIVKATSKDGYHYKGEMTATMDQHHLAGTKTPVVGVYDVGVSDVNLNQQKYECLLLSGYRAIGNGDLYLSYRPAQNHDGVWPEAKLLLAQEELPFHNRPDFPNYEWGLEGAKIVAIAPDIFLLVGVCFKPLGDEFKGMRQRVFFAVSPTLNGPYKPWCLPLEEVMEVKTGEHGHPDVFIEDDKLWMFYQHRMGDGFPWYVRTVNYDLESLAAEGRRVMDGSRENSAIPTLTENTVQISA